MKAGVLGFFLCYVVLPVAFYGGYGLFSRHPVGLLPLGYYVLLVFSLIRCSRMPGFSRHFYGLALAIVLLHLACLLVALGAPESGYSGLKERALTGLLFCIPGVYAAACLAGASLAWEQSLFFQALLQLSGPAYMLVHWNTPFLNQANWSFLPLLAAFFGQGLHACWLGVRRLGEPQPAPLNEVGFSPA